MPLRYEGVGRIIAGVLGSDSQAQIGVTGAYKHVMKPTGSVDGIFFTLAYEILKDLLVYEFNTLKLRRLTIRATIPGRIQLETETIGHDFTDASGINTTTTIDTITLPANREVAQARQFVVRMNAQAGAGLAAADAKYLSAFELTIERPLEADFNTEFGDRSSEPMPPSGEGAFFTVSGNLTFSQLDNAATGGNSPLVMAQMNRSLQKMDVTITGDNDAGTGEKFRHVIYLPMVVLGDGKPTLSQGALGWQIPFTAHHVSAIPTGWPAGYVESVVWENVSTITTGYLA